MPDPFQSSSEFDAIEQAAASWVLRVETGLTPAEETEFADWLAADPRHADLLAEFQAGWNRFTALTADAAATGKLGDRHGAAALRKGAFSRRVVRFAPALLAAAAAVALGFHLVRPSVVSSSPQPQAAVRPVLLPLCELVTLADGSVVELNRGAAITVDFTVGERRVQLVRGEAHFKVAKDAARPFFVRAGGVETRAVGTAFNVRVDSAAVEVVVTEGTVAVATDHGARALSAGPGPAASVTLLSASERALVSLAPFAPVPVVATLTSDELETRLAWKPKLLDFDDVPLAVVVAEFNHRNPVHLTVAEPSLGALRLTASFRSDNIDGFVRLMEANYGVAVDLHGSTEIVLRRQ